MRLDLNCDLGEGEPPQKTEALMRCITSANIACGGHAGDFDTIRHCIGLARKYNVRIGAHPGLADRANFGRHPLPISPTDFKTLLLQQIGAVEKLSGGKLHHIKLHGALYHMVEEQAPLRRAFIEIASELWPKAIIFSLAGGKFSLALRKAGLKNWGEGFLDRAYIDARHLASRDTPEAVLDSAQFEQRLYSLTKNGIILSTTGHPLQIPAQTWCIHSDTHQALAFAKKARLALFGLR